MLPALLLPALAKAGLSLLAKAGIRKGMDYVKEKTGIDLGSIELDADGNIPDDKIVELKTAEMEHEESLQQIALEKFKVGEREDTAKMETVNATMQSETKASKWWSSAWRPFWGFTSAIAFLVVSIFVCVLAYKGIIEGDANALAMIPQFITSIAMLFAIPGGILGVTAWHRGKMQRGK
ncbi:hypothetical protein LCGC14_1169960 [marine sediment metagenome]|uniref:Uncharacterized protein n=1 Tax=marine sediment metagenome TaxID=412755 RepID=A0A0F9PVM4_9ZZZZ